MQSNISKSLKARFIENLAEGIRQRLEETDKRYSVQRGSHFNHIGSNLLAKITVSSGLAVEVGPNKYNTVRDFVESYKTLRTYLDLLDKYTEYREGEMEFEDGYFSDIGSLMDTGGHKVYVEESKKRLEFTSS